MVIDMLMKLEEASDISSRQDVREFLKLFESGESLVVCDLFSTEDFLRRIPVSRYAGYYVNENNSPSFNALTYEFRNIKKLGWSYEHGLWTCRVSVGKTLSYFDENMIYYPLLEQNPENAGFEMEIAIVFDESCSSCRISEILCTNISDFNGLEAMYYIVQKNEDSVDAKRDEMMLFAESPLEYNEFGQAYAPKEDFSFWDDDVFVTAVMIGRTDMYEHIRFKYKPRRFRLRLRNECAPVSAFHVEAPEGVTASSFAYNAGLDIGYAIPVSSSFRLGIYAGLGMTYSRMSIGRSAILYSYALSNDVGDYVRTYSIDNASQSMSFMDLTVPFYLSPEFRVHRLVSITLDLGVKVHLNTSAVLSPLHLSGRVYGAYTDGMSLTDGDYGIGDISDDYYEFVSIDRVRRTPVDVSVMGSVGLDIALYARMLYLQVRAGYEYGVTQSYDSDGRKFSDSAVGIYPLIWSGTYGREVVFRPLVDCVSFWRRSLWFSLGIMVKI